MKFSALIYIAAVVAGASGHVLPRDTPKANTYTYESALRERFDDPTSVEVKDVRRSADGRAVCGQVNGRDRHGVMAGFKRFLVFGNHGAFMVLIADSDQDKLDCD